VRPAAVEAKKDLNEFKKNGISTTSLSNVLFDNIANGGEWVLNENP